MALVGAAAGMVVVGAAVAGTAAATDSTFGQRLRHCWLASVSLRMRRAKPLDLLDQRSR